MAEKTATTGSTWESEHGWVITLGKWVWLFGLANGIVYLIWGIVNVFVRASVPTSPFTFYTTTVPSLWYASRGIGIWYIIGGSFNIIFSIAIVKFKFSNKVKDRDWNFLYEEHILKLGSLRFPLMLLWGILLAVFGFGWGGLLMLIVVFFLLFAGPRDYQWKST
ncbi:MAG: conserved membrane protein of unknown function [Promethearchaeota archaeon]|nr:MAG: conserved membrane protein of unknown function [Candidatus Lokiarchaeota archaeon]